jgi:hypothetical protein
MSKKVVIIGCLLAAAVAALWLFRPVPSYDIQRVDSRLRSLQRPYRNVNTAYYMDGGSIGIEIVDRDGRLEQFAIPSHLGETNRYTKVFVGAMHDRKPGAVEVSDSEQTKNMLVCILAAKSNRTPDEDYYLFCLRGSPADFVHCYVHKLMGEYKR